MTQSQVDFVIVGASLQARLVAGLLAATHGRAVLFIGPSQAAYRLPRQLDLSLAPITRPDTWDLLRSALPEVTTLLKKLGARKAWTRLDPVLFASAPAGRQLLGHLRHMALGFGMAAERVPTAALGRDREGIVLPDAMLLQRALLEPLLDQWLDRLGVRRMEAAPIAVAANGSAQITLGEEIVSATQTVLADDDAILAHLPADAWPNLFTREVASSLLTEPTAPLQAPVMLDLDTGITLLQQAGRGLVAMGRGPLDPFAAAVRVLLGQERKLQQVGQASYTRLVTLDGAPAVGRINGSGPDVLAGFGAHAAFFAPALARWLCGAATPAESAWMAGRLVDRALPSAVADWSAP